MKIWKETMNNYRVVNSLGKEIQTDVSLPPGEGLMDEIEVRPIKKPIGNKERIRNDPGAIGIKTIGI
jgi:hypothetical protein